MHPRHSKSQHAAPAAHAQSLLWANLWQGWTGPPDERYPLGHGDSLSSRRLGRSAQQLHTGRSRHLPK